MTGISLTLKHRTNAHCCNWIESHTLRHELNFSYFQSKLLYKEATTSRVNQLKAALWADGQ